MNCNHRRTSRHTVRIAFELTTPYHQKPRQIWRIRDEHGTQHFKQEGIVLNHTEKQTRVAVVNVTPGDVVLIAHRADNAEMPPHAAYLITESFKPKSIDNVAQLFQRLSVEAPSSLIETNGDTQMRYDKAELQKLLRAKHPRWLEEYVNELLRTWRRHEPNTYMDHAPREWLERDELMLAIYAPYRALSEFRHRLTPDLESHCIRRLASSDARDGFEWLPLEIRSGCLKQNATFVLRNHLHQLTKEELKICAKADPITAYRTRHRLTDSRRAAILLANSFGVAWHTDRNKLGPAFRNEIIESLTQFPDEWLKTTKGFPHIFRRLNHLLGICLDAREIALMHRQIAPAGRGPLRAYIASKI